MFLNNTKLKDRENNYVSQKIYSKERIKTSKTKINFE